jgi:hypothetical protein
LTIIHSGEEITELSDFEEVFKSFFLTASYVPCYNKLMRDKKYKNSKWFVGVALFLLLWGWLAAATAGPEDFSALGFFLFSFGVILCWPIDYWIHKRTVKSFKNKPVAIDPNFKRNRILVLLGLVVFVAFLIFHTQ